MTAICLTLDPWFDFFRKQGSSAREIHYPLLRRASIKDIVESLGIPHSEVGLLLLNRLPVDFAFIPEPGNHLHILPVKTPWDVTKPDKLRPTPLDRIRFIADVNVGKLARLLLITGHDTLFSNRFTDGEIVAISLLEQRIILTRDTNLLKRNQVRYAKRIRESAPYLQLREVYHYFGLACHPEQLFSRCTRCNISLAPVDKDKILHRLEPKTRMYYTHFRTCPGCGQLYWDGSHLDTMKHQLKTLGLLSPGAC